MGKETHRSIRHGIRFFRTQEKGMAALSEERATILYILDVYNKSLFELPKHSVRKVRGKIDNFAKEIVHPQTPDALNETLFNMRQFFSSYRIDESTFVQNTIDDFKRIIWDFADHLSEDMSSEKNTQTEINRSLSQLREAVESNSVDELRAKSREFIDLYVKIQSSSNERRSKRMDSIKKSLTTIKRQLMEANQTMRRDHLTGAHNRRSYDEQIKRYLQLNELDKEPISLVMLDIDHFKKINDNYGHDIGDFILQECVRILHESFSREEDFIARLGGEEFAVILPGCDANASVKIVEKAMATIRKEVFIHGSHQIRFTVSMGIAQLVPGQDADSWYKRADAALYESKTTGRNKHTVASETSSAKPHVA